MSGLQPVMKDDEPPQITRCANTMLPVVQRQPNRAAALGRTIVSRPGNACRYTEQAQRLYEVMQDTTMGNRTCVAVNVRDDSDLHRSMPASSCEPVLLEKGGSLHVFTRLDQRHYRRIARQVCGVPCIRLPLVAGYPFGCLASSLQDIVPGEGQAWLLSILYGDG